jgi:hypothetical protein
MASRVTTATEFMARLNSALSTAASGIATRGKRRFRIRLCALSSELVEEVVASAKYVHSTSELSR